MLVDRRREIERRSARMRRMRQLVPRYGHYLNELAAWTWFINPLTLSDAALTSHHLYVTNMPSHRRPILTIGPAMRDRAFAKVLDFLKQLQAAAVSPVGWVICEERGDLGRLHFHILVSNVAHLNRERWQTEAEKQFGRVRILNYDASRPGVLYVAKSTRSEGGDLHFGGALFLANSQRYDGDSVRQHRGTVIAPSAALPSNSFHQTLRSPHR